MANTLFKFILFGFLEIIAFNNTALASSATKAEDESALLPALSTPNRIYRPPYLRAPIRTEISAERAIEDDLPSSLGGHIIEGPASLDTIPLHPTAFASSAEVKSPDQKDLKKQLIDLILRGMNIQTMNFRPDLSHEEKAREALKFQQMDKASLVEFYKLEAMALHCMDMESLKDLHLKMFQGVPPKFPGRIEYIRIGNGESRWKKD